MWRPGNFRRAAFNAIGAQGQLLYRHALRLAQPLAPGRASALDAAPGSRRYGQEPRGQETERIARNGRLQGKTLLQDGLPPPAPPHLLPATCDHPPRHKVVLSAGQRAGTDLAPRPHHLGERCADRGGNKPSNRISAALLGTEEVRWRPFLCSAWFPSVDEAG